jgi:hypothetical protein
MKKPRIRKLLGWWVCHQGDMEMVSQVGIGGDPVTAFENWNSQVSGLMRKQGEI